MSRNRIKIICNPQTDTLSYQFQNEQRVWMTVSRFSALAERRYTETNIRQSAPAILDIINTVYNPGNRGTDIFFEGPDKDYDYLCKAVNERFSGENISCVQQTIRVAIGGKPGVGKTTLIEALAQKQGVHYTVEPQTGWKHYKSKSTPVEWFELEDIDFGVENIRKAEHTVGVLAEQGLSLFLYCFRSASVGRAEIGLIQHIRDQHPEISLSGILTNAVSTDDTVTAGKLSRMTGIRVLPVIAKDQKTRDGVIKAFGLEDVLRVIFGEE